MDDSRTTINLRRLAEQALDRYSIDAFCAHLYLLLDDPTTELPMTGPRQRACFLSANHPAPAARAR
ncbi:hypothetical protein ACWIGI_34575 [Nocardia sp. NPDC055321]